MLEEKFKTIIEREEVIIKKETASFNIFGTLRLISFIAIVFFSYRYIKEPIDINLYLILFSMFLFIAFVLYHMNIKDKLNYSKGIIDVNKRYLDRISGEWIAFKDLGEEFVDKAHRYSSDLDIVGERSLFQLINLTNTFYGRKILSDDLLNPKYDEEEIALRQEAVEELKGKLEFCQKLELKASDDSIKNPRKMIDYFNMSKEVYSKTMINVLRIMPLAFILVSSAILLFKIESLYRIVFFLFTIQSIIWLLGMSKNNEILGNVEYLTSNLGNYVDILKLIEKEDFQSSLLKDIREKLFSNDASLSAIKKLEMITQRISIKSNGLLYLVFNILFLWDYQNAFSLEIWKKNFGKGVETWLYSIGQIEALMSLTVPLQIEDGLSFPHIDASSFKIEAKEIGHPLIKKEERIYNDITIEDEILIITGSNMSGKTTFLRTLGINIVLANAGTVTFSKEFSLPIMDIYTSMRITDDLKNKISTFYGELLRIKDILDYSEKNKNTFFLIDEIFTGTNSKDRIYGAKNVLRNLNKSGLMGAITTHDLEICQLDSHERIVNYNFSEDYIDGKIDFDYKIKKGKSTSTNAKHLMELVGIDLIE